MRQLKVVFVSRKDISLSGLRFFGAVKPLTMGLNYENSAINNCWISAREGNKIAPLQHKCQVKQGMRAKGVQFYYPSSTYPAIILLVLYFIA